MADIFLYTPETRLNSMHIKVLREAGIIPIKVASLDSVKQLARPMTMPDFELDMLAYVAFKTIKEYGQYAHSAFGRNVAELMVRRTAIATEAQRAATGNTDAVEDEGGHD